MDEKHCQWDVIVETCFDQKTRFSVTSTTNVRDLKLHCELELAIPAELQVMVHENMELDNTIAVTSLPSPETTKTFKLHVISELQSFASSCMKGDIESMTKGIQDKTNYLNTEQRAFVAAFIAAGTGKGELLNSLLEGKECFVDINRRTKLSRRSLLHAAVAGGDLSCVVNIMVMTRGSLDLLYFQDEKHESPLDLARRLEKPALVELLEKYGKKSSEAKTVSAEESEQEKTNLEIICLESTSTSLNELDLTSENKNDKQQDQVSGWITEASQCEIRGKRAQTPVCKDDSTHDRLAKQGSDLNGVEKKDGDKPNEALDQRNVMECSSLSPKDVPESKTEQTAKNSTHKTQKEKRKTSQQTKTRFRKSSLKLRIPLRNKKKSVQESASSQSMVNDEAIVEKTQSNSADKHTPKNASPSSGTVPKIKIIKNLDSARDHHVNTHAHGSVRARLSPTTENLITTQRPFSARSLIASSPTTPRRLICGRPRSSTIEKDQYSSHSPPRASPPAVFCIPHPPVSPSSSRRQSWSPSPDLVAKLSPILQRKFGSACDLERPLSGTLKL